MFLRSVLDEVSHIRLKALAQNSEVYPATITYLGRLTTAIINPFIKPLNSTALIPLQPVGTQVCFIFQAWIDPIF